MHIPVPRLNNGQYAWWLAGDTGLRTPIAHSKCSHRKYRLTCAQFETLLERSGRRCEACGDTGHLLSKIRSKGFLPGRLHIDHDHQLGIWAVRGLLCNRCNSTIDDDPLRSGDLAAYEAHAYWRCILGDLGAASMPSEPPVHSDVLDFAFRRWRRTDAGWVARHNYAKSMSPLLTWADLIEFSGPHNLRLAAATA